MKGLPGMIGPTPNEIALAGKDGGAHARLAQSLRDAAHYIETHPDLPIPSSAEIHHCVTAATDKDGENQLHAIAAILGVPVKGGEHSEARLSFGPVCYSATYITRASMDAYNAHMKPYLATLRAQQEGPVAS